jgi:hypothetical protein
MDWHWPITFANWYFLKLGPVEAGREEVEQCLQMSE